MSSDRALWDGLGPYRTLYKNVLLLLLLLSPLLQVFSLKNAIAKTTILILKLVKKEKTNVKTKEEKFEHDISLAGE